MTSYYSHFKPAWHLDRLGMLRSGGHPAPVQVQLVISDFCNHDCSFCAYRMTGYTSNADFGVLREDGSLNHNPKRFIPAEKCLEILGDCKEIGVKAIQFTGGGEPTAHPDHLEVFAHAQTLGLKTSLVSNGNVLRDGWRDVFPKMDWIRFSLDAGFSGTYAAIRGVPESRFSTILANATKVAGELDRTATVFGASFVVTRENMGELVQAAASAKDSGFHSIRFTAIFTPNLERYYRNTEIEAIGWDIVEARRRYEDGDFKIISMFGSRVADLEQGVPNYPKCGYQYFNCYVGGDQKVYRCCNTAYNELGRVGDLSGKRFRDWFAEEATHRAYSKFSPKSCAHCAFNGQNVVLNALAFDPPQHLEFP